MDLRNACRKRLRILSSHSIITCAYHGTCLPHQMAILDRVYSPHRLGIVGNIRGNRSSSEKRTKVEANEIEKNQYCQPKRRNKDIDRLILFLSDTSFLNTHIQTT